MITGGCETRRVSCGAFSKASVPAGNGSAGVEGGLQPGDFLLDQHHVETAGRFRAQPAQVVARGEHDAPLLGGPVMLPPAPPCAPVLRACAPRRTPAFRRGSRMIRSISPPPRPGRPIIARDQPQAGPSRWSSAASSAASPCDASLWWSSCSLVFLLAISEKPLASLAPLHFGAALAAARDAAGAQHYPQGALYVVATPIGNLADITCAPCMCCSWWT
jgi:hypothetical protein